MQTFRCTVPKMDFRGQLDRSDPHRSEIHDLDKLLRDPKGLGIAHIAQVNRFAA